MKIIFKLFYVTILVSWKNMYVPNYRTILYSCNVYLFLVLQISNKQYSCRQDNLPTAQNHRKGLKLCYNGDIRFYLFRIRNFLRQYFICCVVLDLILRFIISPILLINKLIFTRIYFSTYDVLEFTLSRLTRNILFNIS